MTASGEAFVGIDTAKMRNAVAVAEGGREGELRYLGEFDNTPDSVAKLIRKLAGRYATLHICYEAGPTGYGLCSTQGASRRRSFTPAQPDNSAASVRDFRSGAYRLPDITRQLQKSLIHFDIAHVR
jgi:hypothetical protein